jgi:hypothetical protein
VQWYRGKKVDGLEQIFVDLFCWGQGEGSRHKSAERRNSHATSMQGGLAISLAIATRSERAALQASAALPTLRWPLRAPITMSTSPWRGDATLLGYHSSFGNPMTTNGRVVRAFFGIWPALERETWTNLECRPSQEGVN